MATLVLAAAGGALGATMGGTVAGLSAAVAGRALGASLGQALDQRLMGSGSQIVEQGRVERFRLTGASEGAAIARLYGRNRIGGQVIWASDFIERRSTTRAGGGKGGGGGAVRSYSYRVSLAIALCEGEISHVGRIWADGAEIDRDRLTLRVYTGGESQLPDPAIAAVEGNGNAPAFRGIAYVLFENLELAPFGNRVPQFSFEVARPDQAGAEAPGQSLRRDIRGVALIPGTGEYALATTPVRYETGPGEATSANRHASSERSDIEMSLDALEAELPNCRSVSLVVSWFGNDLRCGEASIRPKIEQNEIDGTPMAWNVAGEDRAGAARVPMKDGRPIYGGTPADRSVVEAIRELRARGQSVMFYPFILMDQTEGNGRIDPWTGAADQPAFPWRGRITLSRAPGQPGSPDGTTGATAEVAAFFGAAKASDFTVADGSVSYAGPQEWSFRRFILHYAALCAAAGGVEAFCIGSEMRSLTQIRGADHSFPAVEELVRLAVEVRALLGAGTKIGYAADWSEYSGYAPADGSGDRFFHLDPLWAHPAIDFIGIDNYMALSDWRDGTAHADAGFGSIHDLEYLKSNVAGGEGFDWYYASAADAEAQRRLPITDGAYGEPWVHRVKDIRSWWSMPHFDRIGGVRKPTSTGWVPMSKPVWFTELGCAAIDKGTNEPNKFLDPKSSESALPRASTGARDDLIQVQYLRAMYGYWEDPANNPTSGVYGGPMVDMDFAHVWAWDARPYPWFPGLPEVWGDGENYARGHWLNGRMSSRTLASVVAEICGASGLDDADVTALYGLVRGYSVTEAGTARGALQPLMLAYGFDASERDGRVIFRNRPVLPVRALAQAEIARHPDLESAIGLTRAAEAELPERVRLSSLAADAGYEVQSSESSLPDARGDAVSQSDMNLVLTASEARAATERWLTEGRIARDTARFALPPSRMDLGPGEVVSLAGAEGLWRLDRVEQDATLLVEAVRIETGIYRPGRGEERQPVIEAPAIPGPLACVFLDLPLLNGNEGAPHAPYVAVAGRPWPGEVAVYSSATDTDYALNTLVGTPAAIGRTLDPLPFAVAGVFDRGPALRVRLPGAVLSSVSVPLLLAGANAIAIGTGAPREWEVLQFRDAELVGPDTYALSMRLRGQAGTDAFMPPSWPAGSTVVLLDGALQQIDLPASARGLSRTYRIGPASLPHSHASFVQVACTADGVGLRPYSPCHLRGETLSGGTHRFSWIRRTRIDGDAWDLADVPLGEGSERYELRILVDGKVKRRITASVPQADYTPAQRMADGVDADYRIEVAQVSDRFGPGPVIGMTYHG